MAEPNRLAAALSYEQDRPAFGNPSMLEQGRKMRERKQAEQVDRSAQNVKSDLLARALMYRYNPETLTGLTDTPEPQTLDEAAGLNPRVDRSTFLPYSKKEGLHVPAVAADLMKLATASNPQYSNLMQPEEAMPLATNMMGGGVVASKLAPAPAGSLGMFIGKTAKNWNAAAEAKALKMEKAGANPQAIWQETGTWKGPDKQWRQEIPDSAARINESKPISANEWIENDIPNVPGTNPVGKVFDSKHGGALLYHPELPNAYTPLDIATNANIVGSNSLLRSERGFFDPESKNISIFGGSSADEAKSTMLHELQHAIQTKEGWSKGGNPASIAQDQARAKARVGFLNSELSQAAKDLDRFKNGTPEYAAARETYDSAMREKLNISPSLFQSDSYDGYRLLAGEAEARATQARRNMTAEERRAKFPAESYDVPIDQLIIRQ